MQPPPETRRWLQRTRRLCSALLCQCDTDAAPVGTVLCSAFCCANHFRKGWLSEREVLARLQEWKRKRANADENFLGFTELRAALEGAEVFKKRGTATTAAAATTATTAAAPSGGTADNFQVDALMAGCTLRLSRAAAAKAQARVDANAAAGISTQDFVKERARRERQQLRGLKKLQRRKRSARSGLASGGGASDVGSALADSKGAFEALMQLKQRQLESEMRLKRHFDEVEANQAATLDVLKGIAGAVEDLDSIPS